jgi:probable F420-dependent oxidoreductase
MVSDTAHPRRGVCVFAASIDEMQRAAAAADRAGFDAVWTSELYNRSATVTVAACATATTACSLGTGILYGVGRSPLMLAAEARDLDELSRGRFVLGIGNGTRRMISDWHGLDGDAPAVRMEELVPLVRRIWNLGDGPIRHDGRFYRLRIAALEGLAGEPVRDIPIYAAAVNPRMVEAAGRVADGLLGHTLFTPRYIEEVVRPALHRGAQRAERDTGAVRLATYTLAACAQDEEVARREAAAMIAFYGSVKSYAGLFEICGFGAEAQRIREAFAARDVEAMVAAVTDAMVDELSVAGTPDQVNDRLRRFDGIVDEVVLTVPSFRISPERVAENLALLTQHCAPGR